MESSEFVFQAKKTPSSPASWDYYMTMLAPIVAKNTGSRVPQDWHVEKICYSV